MDPLVTIIALYFCDLNSLTVTASGPEICFIKKIKSWTVWFS